MDRLDRPRIDFEKNFFQEGSALQSNMNRWKENQYQQDLAQSLTTYGSQLAFAAMQGNTIAPVSPYHALVRVLAPSGLYPRWGYRALAFGG